MYERKTYDVWEVQADYGYGDGWETVYEDDCKEAAYNNYKIYRKEDAFARKVRIIKKRYPKHDRLLNTADVYEGVDD